MTAMVRTRPPIVAGARYGRLVLISKAVAYRGKWKWFCVCDCGGLTLVLDCNLKRTRSCGCWLRRQRGLSTSREFRSWAAMVARCTKAGHEHFRYYGGRGITVCDRWIHSFATFLSDMGPRPADTTLDRIDVNGNYEPGNCRWVTWDVQCKNKRHRSPREAA